MAPANARKTANRTTAKKAKPPARTAPPRGAKPVNGTEDVDACMAYLGHPLKADVARLRQAILAAAPGIQEQVKWNAPSFRTAKDYLCTFNLSNPKRLLVIFHNPLIPRVASPLLTGDWKDRRIATFTSTAAAKSGQTEVVRVVRALVQEMDA